MMIGMKYRKLGKKNTLKSGAACAKTAMVHFNIAKFVTRSIVIAKIASATRILVLQEKNGLRKRLDDFEPPAWQIGSSPDK
jgi:hypothetical protein